jgi:hypothetical protein
MGPLIKYTDRLYDLFDEIGGKIAQNLIKLEGDPSVMNDYYIKLIDVSEDDFCFEVTNTEGEIDNMKVGSFVRHFLEKTWTDQEFFDFMSDYNGMKKRFFKDSKKKEYVYGYSNLTKDKSKEKIVTGTPVEVPSFTFNPQDVRSTFISLVTSTYPHGHEEEVVPFIKDIGLKKDIFGNYYKIIGNSKTMFTSHLDTADRKKSKVTLLSELKGGHEILKTNGKTILGADDKAGVTVMLHMMVNNIPGVYYFFIGEERGGIGSYKVADSFDTFPHLKNIERCVSFDRRNNISVITSQLGRRCCSDTFAQALCDEYSKGGLKLSLDNTGVYTDSASFIDHISECTNISVGYMHEHTINEYQDITYLEQLAKASLSVNWESLPATRKSGLSDEIKRKYGKFLSDLKRCKIDMDWELISENGEAHIFVEMEGTISDAHLDLMIIEDLCERNKINPVITFESYYFKMELK